MGERKRRSLNTAQFLKLHPFCCYCGGATPATTRDHYPPKILFDRKNRPDDFVSPACKACNSGTRKSDLVASYLARTRFGDSPDVENEDSRKLARAIRNNCGELISEWLISGVAQKRAKKNFMSRGVPIDDELKVIRYGPKTRRHLDIFAHKLTLAMYHKFALKPLSQTGLFEAFIVPKENVAANGLPQHIMEMFGPVLTLSQGNWETSEQFQFRHTYNSTEGAFGFVARIRTGFFVFGFVVERACDVSGSGRERMIEPRQLLGLLSDKILAPA